MARRAQMTTGDWMPAAERGYWLISVSWLEDGLEEAKARRDMGVAP
jgi:hypothetical protein